MRFRVAASSVLGGFGGRVFEQAVDEGRSGMRREGGRGSVKRGRQGQGGGG